MIKGEISPWHLLRLHNTKRKPPIRVVFFLVAERDFELHHVLRRREWVSKSKHHAVVF